MNKKRLIVVWAALVLFAITASGCALIGTAVSVATAYGIYKATKK